MPIQRKISSTEIYQIKVTLLRTAPPIWRRLLVPSDITLADLHDLLQLAMGWTDSHLHEFLFRGKRYGSTNPEVGVTEAIDERKVRLNQLLSRVGAKIVYTYDFGDGWEHGIVLEKGLPVEPNMAYPLFSGGRGACPPEDCGGLGGFYNFLKGWVKTSIRKSSPARRSTGYCTEEKGGRLDLQDKNASELRLLAASTDAPGSPHTGLPKGHIH